MVETYEREGKIAVLVSYGYGAGWSTWNNRNLAIDKRVVEFWLEHHDDEYCEKLNNKNRVTKQIAEWYFKSIGYDNVYFGGYSQIKLEWVPKGTCFRIKEYDGAEGIEVFNKDNWFLS